MNSIRFDSNGIMVGKTWYPVISHLPREARDSIAHAANAYPKLVAALKMAYRSSDKAAREEIGALLSELGEAS